MVKLGTILFVFSLKPPSETKKKEPGLCGARLGKGSFVGIFIQSLKFTGAQRSRCGRRFCRHARRKNQPGGVDLWINKAVRFLILKEDFFETID